MQLHCALDFHLLTYRALVPQLLQFQSNKWYAKMKRPDIALKCCILQGAYCVCIIAAYQ